MSKYIDASLVVEVHVYDDEHEEWGMWSVTIEELLNRWTGGVLQQSKSARIV